MKRKKFYRHNLNRKIDFICKKCKSKMTFSKDRSDIKIKCPGCGVTFFIEVEIRQSVNNLVYWIPGNGKTNEEKS